MTKFNPENREVLTYEQCLGPAMKITEREDAQQYLQAYKTFIQRDLDNKKFSSELTANEIALGNFGYYAGYYDPETQRRVQNLFGAAHPVFGAL